MLVLTLTTFFFGGFAREQICIYACPWPRIQAAMVDEDTLTIGYRDWRGEPRGKQTVEGNGDCIDCMACVNVCPMGIDIRNGQQMACITCGLCIDACNDVMDRIGKPRDLIGYLALTDEVRERAGPAAEIGLGACVPGADGALHRAVGRGRHRPCRGAVPALAHRRERDPGPQPDLCHAVGRQHPQRL
jgi:polyferredoxin